MRDILAWALATEILGLAVLPLLRAFFSNRRDAALLSRPLGLALVAYLGWALSLASGMGFRRFTLLLVVLVVAAVAWLASRRGSDEVLRAPVWGDEEKLAALLFWGSTAIFLAIRAAGPAILGAEKFMDLAFLNSLARYPALPPADPWMAGNTINYYYWGYLLAAAQAKLSGVPPLTAYNLAVSTFGGFSFCAAACLGLRLSRGRLGVGLGAAVGTVFASNVVGALDAWNKPLAADFDYWHASRVIGPENFKTINEFPFFTFFHADLHPHLLAFPYFIAAFAVAHRWMEAGGDRGLRRWLGVFLLALTAGTARAASLWNMPALVILLAVCGLFLSTRGERLPRPLAVLGGILAGLGVGLLSLLLFYPYTASFELENRGLGRATQVSGLLEFLGVWGLLLAVGFASLWPRPSDDTEQARRRRDFVAVLAIAAALLAGFLARMPAMALVLLLGIFAVRAAWRSLHAPDGDAPGMFAAFLLILGLGMIGGCELVFFKDSYGQDLQRMNTIFKFYHQAWPLLAVGVAVFAGRAWEASLRRRPVFRALVAAAALLALLWPANVIVSRFRQKDGPFSFDARGPLARRDAGDAAAIDWLVGNAPEGSVVLEASGDPYSEFSRISSHTGIPTVLGWANHEGLWRSNDGEVNDRLSAIRSFYTTRNPLEAWEILRKYGVTHVVLGNMERRTYPNSPAIVQLPFLRPVHTGDTVVFQVAPPQ